MKKDKMSSSNPAKDQDPKGGHLIPDNILKKIAGITPTFPNYSGNFESNSNAANEKEHSDFDSEVAGWLYGRVLGEEKGPLPTKEEVYKVAPSCQVLDFFPYNKRGVPSQQQPLRPLVGGGVISRRVLPPGEVEQILRRRGPKI